MKNICQLTDEILVKLYEDGNNQAFEHYYRATIKSLHVHLSNCTQIRNLPKTYFRKHSTKAITIQQGRYVETGRFLGCKPHSPQSDY